MTTRAVLALVDSAQAFLDQPEDPAALAEAVRKLGLAELSAATARVRAAEDDARGKALAAAAEQLGHLVPAGGLHEGFAKAALEEAAASCGLIRVDGLKAVKKLITDGFKRGKKSPRAADELRRQAAQGEQSRPRIGAADRMSFPGDDPLPASAAFFSAAPAPPADGSEDASSQMGAAPKAATGWGRGGAQKPPDASEGDDERNMRLAFFPLTDLGNAERFRERYRDRLLWNVALGWLVWDGKRWSRNGADDLVKIAEHDTVRAIQKEAKAVRASGCKDKPDAPRGARDYVVKVDRDGNETLYSDKIAAWGRSSEAVNKLSALSKRGAPYFAMAIDRLDADKMRINVNNGTLVVRRRDDGDYVSFQPHDPADLITKLAPVDYEPNADRPVFDAFLARIQPRAEMRAFLQQWLGLSLTGDVSEQKLAFFYGKGGNGKSVLIDAVSYVAGDYGETVPIETFLDQGKARSAGQATPDLAMLPAVRMLRTSEPEKNSRLAEAMIKLVTGGEPIQARHLNRDFFKFYPQFKLTMSGNYRPQISGTDEGIWRRVRLVPFQVIVPKDERDIHLPDRLRGEASGILNWLLDGLRTWCDKGLHEPDDVVQATAEYRSASDPLGRFLATCVVESAGDRVQSSVLHEVYEAWCKASGEKAWSGRGLSMAMDERGFKRKQSNVMWWLDIKLTKSVNDFVDAQGHPIRIVDGAEQTRKEAGDMEF
jgi:putative DNA primase/helicase